MVLSSSVDSTTAILYAVTYQNPVCKWFNRFWTTCFSCHHLNLKVFSHIKPTFETWCMHADSCVLLFKHPSNTYIAIYINPLAQKSMDMPCMKSCLRLQCTCAYVCVWERETFFVLYCVCVMPCSIVYCITQPSISCICSIDAYAYRANDWQFLFDGRYNVFDRRSLRVSFQNFRSESWPYAVLGVLSFWERWAHVTAE